MVLSAPPSRLIKDEYGNDIGTPGLESGTSGEIPQTVQHPPVQDGYSRIPGMGRCDLFEI